MDLTHVLLSASPADWLFGQILKLFFTAHDCLMKDPVAPPSRVMSNAFPFLVNTVNICDG